MEIVAGAMQVRLAIEPLVGNKNIECASRYLRDCRKAKCSIQQVSVCLPLVLQNITFHSRNLAAPRPVKTSAARAVHKERAPRAELLIIVNSLREVVATTSMVRDTSQFHQTRLFIQ